ncbi:glycoside hydrolase family 16 protein [Fomitiporia mediterranea MF3/22]|uniref:glycoside hydrolase family 16 protein n=1 Tax=Fomitiporia mediterranea (strain MF3/22) TaxID=694068 RepID=UPI00044096BB|nr:glycoside hydrolase family 16 protein [Fomitiporia mediterranea MF3/22]EJD00925.1 glycoside hydrolase family 16 protein [Fomitiporia mediterranea MF3/22]
MWHTSEPEDDDALHAPEDYGHKGRSARATQPFVLCSLRGWLNVGTLGLLLAALLGLFIGYPIVLHIVDKPTKTPGFNLGGINATGQVPDLPIKRLIDPMTPQDAMSRTGSDGEAYNLVFSDEFETDDRTFYPGDDPYWEAQDLHYWPTGDMEWYDPSTITTKNGKLVITLDQKDPINNHNLSYTSGMLTTWNKFCFTTGYIEARVSLPGSSDVPGLWPGIWTMGNLGRAGYGATTEGMWPYSYDSCDLGTFPRQMDKSGNPATSATDGWQGSFLSDQPGQRLSACTCPGSDHPGPKTSNGRAAPELDVIEAQIDLGTLTGEVSQSYQIAPFNAFVKFVNSSPETTIYDPSITKFNSFTGTALQQAISGVTKVSSDVYNDKAYTTYAFEYWSDMKNRDEGYVLWYSSGQPSWKITSASIGPDPVSQVDQRLIPEEPMYIILNLGLSTSFTTVDLDKLVFPSKMYIDYVRVYQREGVSEGVTCDPSHHPTADYIKNHPDAYTNWNWTTWDQAGYQLPRNSKYDGC